MSASEDTSFPRLVLLACHDLRTPLATVSGFAKTLMRVEGVDDKMARYLGLMETASEQLAELLEELNVAARIAGGRYDPALRQVDTLELARAAAEREEGVEVVGSGR
jgi:signal transduction histidine kinase